MEIDEKYFIFENRLDSFRRPRPVSQARVSSATSRAPKVLHWPHETLSPVALAKAGFFFEPHPKSPDNVVCFLCGKSLDGWEAHDNPVEEHLKHSPTCGWAIIAAIEAGYGNYGKVHPLDPAMIEARKATFGGRWPYESKKAFKCKTKKLVEGGWKYTPSLESDDMTTCAYCNLALEGWESDDNPINEHHKREPGCPFFALINQYPAPKKERTRKTETSKSSRLSVQSVATVATVASDFTSAADITADHDDSVMTTASTMTQGGKKSTRGRKPAATKGRKTKAKKDEAVEVLEDAPRVEDPPKQTATRGRKRASDAMEDPTAAEVEAPAPKKRATRGRTSTATVSSSVADTEMLDAIPAKQPAGKKKGRTSTSKTRKASRASLRSQASTASLRADLPDDDELDRQLEADLERYQSDVDEVAVGKPAPAARGRPKKSVARKTSSQHQKAQSESYAAFDPAPVEPDEAEIDAELEALQVEMKVESSEALVVPKKGRKAGTRKVSKQTKKAKEPVPPPEPEVQIMEDAPTSEPVDGVEQLQEADLETMDDPDVSTGTVVTKPAGRLSTTKRGRGRPPKKSTSSQMSTEEPRQLPSSDPPSQTDAQPDAAHPRESSSAPKVTPIPIPTIPRKAVPVASQASTQSEIPAPAPPAAPTPVKSEKALPLPPPSSAASRLPQPATPRSARTQRASQVALAPATSPTAATTPKSTQFPDDEDAENIPPSLRPAANITASARRVVLSPVTGAAAQATTTPMRSSPTRRNFVSGLQSTTPWRPADLEQLISSLVSSSSPTKGGGGGGSGGDDEDKENGTGTARALVQKMQQVLRGGAELTAQERKMTVEEWIYHNAGLAEQKLKRECEAMVAAFEREGGRAMRVLEGLVVE